MQNIRQMMSLKSVLLIALALLFLAGGVYIFHASTREYLGRRVEEPHPHQVEAAPDPEGGAHPIHTPVHTE